MSEQKTTESEREWRLTKQGNRPVLFSSGHCVWIEDDKLCISHANQFGVVEVSLLSIEVLKVIS